MKNLALGFALVVFTQACASIAGDSMPKAITVTDLNILKKGKPEEFNSKYAGKKIVVVGAKTGYWSDDPEAFQSLGHQSVILGGKEGQPVECLVKLPNASKFKGMKDGDMLTVTGNLKVDEGSMELEDCDKFTAPK